ncbi:hypothetical protein DEJ51_26300 [Streptomyces venezuelae]|uniref:DUF596 domain-containing protein n=2 Tax=Streptomyces venezuelae TaxID=54571 RepID=A0A5P2DVI7_STRVZ|nr:hypothetical protein DEJ51_26300 [Streptomyces venezuelae]
MLMTTHEEADVHAAMVAADADCWDGGQPRTFSALLDYWGEQVAGVEEGYAWCLDDFDYEIWCRTVLARVWPLLPPDVRSARQPRLDELDERFRAATIEWPDRGGEERWWLWRFPRLLFVEAGDSYDGGWPAGWLRMPFPKPDAVRVVV